MMKFLFLTFVISFSFAACASQKTEEATTSNSSAPVEPTKTSDDRTTIGKGTVISFLEEITFKNKSKTNMMILHTSVNDKSCAFSVMLKKGTTYSITPDQKIVFSGTRKATSQLKHSYTVYMFNAPGGRTVELACTDRLDLDYEEVRDAWEFRGESSVIIRSE